MNHDSELKDFLKKNININNDRLNKAKKKVNPEDGTLINFIENNIGDKFLGSSYQGSFGYHTIIKPNIEDDTGDYDVDIAIRLKYDSEYEGNEYKYHDLLINAFNESERYKDKLDESKERAVRIQYSSNDGEFHVDLVPMFYDNENWNVINKANSETEISGGNEFRDWVNEQNNKTSTEESKSKYLKEVIRIFKYLRNRSNSEIIRSVQFTLLLGRQIDNLEDETFKNLGSTLYGVALELKTELENIEELSELDLENPGLTGEYFDRNLDEVEFNDFKTWFIELANKIIEAYDDEDEKESLEKWRDVFGENFAPNLSKNSIIIYDYNHAHKPQDYGLIKTTEIVKIDIIAEKISKHNYSKKSYFASGDRIPNKMVLRFYALVDENIGNNTLLWQITNEGNYFVRNKRGEINNESSNLGYCKKNKGYGIEEEGSWKGRHWVKCFMKDINNNIVGESDMFLVKIA